MLAGALARADLVLDFERGPFAFLEHPAFLLAVLAVAVLFYALERRRPSTGPAQDAPPPGRSPVELALLAVAVILGALLFAGSLAEGGVVWWPGLVAGGLCAALAYAAVAGLLGRARRRVDPSAAAILTVYAELFTLALAGLSILIPPVSLVALVLFAVLLVRGRSAREQKFEGLRILR